MEHIVKINKDLVKNKIISDTPIGWHFVLNHLGVIMNGSFSTRSLMISNEALPDPMMIPALSVVKL